LATIEKRNINTFIYRLCIKNKYKSWKYAINMPLVKVTDSTRFECTKCGRCCHDLIISKGIPFSIKTDSGFICKYFDNSSKLCTIYSQRPFMCKLYPFLPDYDKTLDEKQIAHPLRPFMIENLSIHTECPGFGNGKKIVANRKLLKHIESIAYYYADALKYSFEKKEDIRKFL
jgi:Fe-S-cluster containining protein